MTTPERLRARQRRESFALGLLAIALAGSVIYSAAQDSAQRRCVGAFIAADNETSAVRSDLVEDESRATRRVIRAALTAETREDIILARSDYYRALKRIDRVRADNPVRDFPAGICD